MSVNVNTTTSTIIVQNTNQTITVVDGENTKQTVVVVDNGSGNIVNVTQPLVNVIEVVPLQDNNQTIVVVDNESANVVNVTQPLVNVIEVASPGPTGPAGPSIPFTNIGNDVYATTSSLQVTGPFLISSSTIFTNIGLAVFSGSTAVSGALVVNGFDVVTVNQTSSLTVLSASYAATASYVLNTVSSSFATTASFIVTAQTASYVQNAQTASYVANAISSSFASTASYVLNAVSSSFATTASYINPTFISQSAAASGFGAGAGVTYVSSSNNPLNEIEVADYDNNVAVTFVDGRLKFIFGTPTAPSAPVASFNSTFATDRFNQVSDAYTVTGTIAVGGFTLISASLYEDGDLLANTGSLATQLVYSATTTGSHTYVLQVTASSPLDATINTQAVTLTGTLSKTNPGAPTITPTATVQLGAASNQIEQGATGSITFTSASGTANSWIHVFTTSSTTSPIFVTGSNTGSNSIAATATSHYSSSGVLGADNSPALTTTTTATFTYTKIRSLRYGASAATSFTAAELENASAWDTTLGGTVGTISKGTTTATGQTLTITWTGDKYHYIAFNSSLASLTNITTGGFGVFSSFTLTTVGSYKVYRSNTLQAGGAGTSITYVLT